MSSIDKEITTPESILEGHLAVLGGKWGLSARTSLQIIAIKKQAEYYIGAINLLNAHLKNTVAPEKPLAHLDTYIKDDYFKGYDTAEMSAEQLSAANKLIKSFVTGKVRHMKEKYAAPSVPSVPSIDAGQNTWRAIVSDGGFDELDTIPSDLLEVDRFSVDFFINERKETEQVLANASPAQLIDHMDKLEYRLNELSAETRSLTRENMTEETRQLAVGHLINHAYDLEIFRSTIQEKINWLPQLADEVISFSGIQIETVFVGNDGYAEPKGPLQMLTDIVSNDDLLKISSGIDEKVAAQKIETLNGKKLRAYFENILKPAYLDLKTNIQTLKSSGSEENSCLVECAEKEAKLAALQKLSSAAIKKMAAEVDKSAPINPATARVPVTSLAPLALQNDIEQRVVPLQRIRRIDPLNMNPDERALWFQQEIFVDCYEDDYRKELAHIKSHENKRGWLPQQLSKIFGGSDQSSLPLHLQIRKEKIETFLTEIDGYYKSREAKRNSDSLLSRHWKKAAGVIGTAVLSIAALGVFTSGDPEPIDTAAPQKTLVTPSSGATPLQDTVKTPVSTEPPPTVNLETSASAPVVSEPMAKIVAEPVNLAKQRFAPAAEAYQIIQPATIDGIQLKRTGLDTIKRMCEKGIQSWVCQNSPENT